jgi:DNA-binding NtrC family response regulator
MPGRLLIVDDEAEMVESTARLLTLAGHRCTTTTVAEEALALLESGRPDVLLTDLKMPGIEGLDLMRRAHRIDPDLPVILITAFASIESAVAAVKDGAFDYLPKPFSAEQLRVAVDRALRQRELRLENRSLRQQLQQTFGLESIIGRSPVMGRVFELIKKAARSEANILVLGESGTGKELVARAIHANSERASRPFVPVDCASLPEQLLESELFGHEKGAFTGALATRPGRIEQAAGGVLFLDEVGEMSPAVQAKFLRVLQEREYQRLGGTRNLKADVRVLAATNRNLKDAIGKGDFREDLYYRLAVFDIALPPLRERPEDIPLLVEAFLEEIGRSVGRPAAGVSREAQETLVGHAWPGNVRELRNAIERAVILCEGGLITSEHLPLGVVHAPKPQAVGTAPAPPGALTLDAAEREMILQALAKAGNNKSKAARLLGLTRAQLRSRIEKHGLTTES